MLNIFSCAFWPSVCLLCRNVYLDHPPIFLLGAFFFFFIELYVLFLHLEINPLWVAPFANSFSSSIGCLFVSFTISIAVQNFWSEVKLLSRVRLFATPWTVAYQASPMGFSRQEYRSGLPCPTQEIFPTQGLNLGLPHYRQILYQLSHQGSPI